MIKKCGQWHKSRINLICNKCGRGSLGGQLTSQTKMITREHFPDYSRDSGSILTYIFS